jgi:predicted protein tyrosine phosphatase
MSEINQVILGRTILGKILILPRMVLKEFTYSKPWGCISIIDSVAIYPEISEENRVNILQISFDDIIKPKLSKVTINDSQGKEIVDFVSNIWDKIDLLMIHCNAGMCRSPAVGKAISNKYQPKYVNDFDKLYVPNPLVYDTVFKHLKPDQH